MLNLKAACKSPRQCDSPGLAAKTNAAKEVDMGEELSAGCARPTGGTVGEEPRPESESQEKNLETKTMIMVGQKAPDFQAPGYHNGKFISMKLSENLGKWTLLCFYPGDFTFV
jgi:peroxiredoxin (alkyl hydroperoxide reductase subunit C)